MIAAVAAKVAAYSAQARAHIELAAALNTLPERGD